MPVNVENDGRLSGADLGHFIQPRTRLGAPTHQQTKYCLYRLSCLQVGSIVLNQPVRRS